MKITCLQTIAPLLLKGLDKGTIFRAGPELELEVVFDGDRRDVLIHRPGYDSELVWQENVASATVAEESERIEPSSEGAAAVLCPCPHCGRTFASLKAVGAHARRAHPEQFA